MSSKMRILELLEKNSEGSLPSKAAVELLDVSNDSSWKAVNSLRQEDYGINAQENRLSDDNNILSIEGMLPYLSIKDWGSKIQIYDSLESTNETAKEMSINGCEHGTIIFADTQTAGRGRYGRYFHSPAGSGLYMSIVLRPEYFNFRNSTVITLFAAVAVCEAIRDITGKQPMIKWVNDVFLDGVKICGILTEAMTDLENFQSLILGIGVNFNTRTEEFPDELRQIAGSIYSNGNIPTTRNCLAAEIINKVLAKDDGLSEKEILKKYKAYSFILGKDITVIQGQEAYEATAMDIDSMGHLMVRKKDGGILTLSSGEVRIRTNKLGDKNESKN